MKNVKEFFKVINRLRKTPRGKAILFFSFYLIFFIILAFIARMGKTPVLDDVQDDGLDFNITNIVAGNYKFQYDIYLDGVVNSYSGSVDNNEAVFVKDNIETYFYTNNKYFSNASGIWLVVENPFSHYYNFMDSSNILKIINKARSFSKTEYDTGMVVYNYKISSKDLNLIFNLDVSDSMSEDNDLNFTVDEDGNVVQINYVLDSYCRDNLLCITAMRVSLRYDNFGEVSKIINPLE